MCDAAGVQLYLHLYSKYKRKYCVGTFILTPFSNLARREYHGKDDTQLAVGRREGQVVFQLERSLYYCKKSVYCLSRSDAELISVPYRLQLLQPGYRTVGLHSTVSDKW